MAINKIIYNGKDVTTWSEEQKNNIINNAFFGKENDWGPFIVEDDNIDQINIDNGESTILGDAQPNGATLCVQGIKMFLNAPTIPNNIDEDEETARNYIQHIAEHLYTSWNFENTSSIIELERTSNGHYRIYINQKSLNFRHSITNKNGNILQYKTQFSEDNGESWQNFGTGNAIFEQEERNTGWQDVSGSAQWRLGLFMNYQNIPLYAYINLQNIKYYGTYFCIKGIVQESSVTYPYGYVTVQPYFFVASETDVPTQYTSPGSTLSNKWKGNEWKVWAGYYSGGYYGASSNSNMTFTVPFRSEAEKNYALGITEKYKRITAEEYSTMTGLIVPTAEQINQHYEETNGGE